MSRSTWTETDPTLSMHRTRLLGTLRSYGRVAVAFSGGIDSTVVTQVRIEAPASAVIELSADKHKRESFHATLEPAGPYQPNLTVSTQLVIFGDQIELQGGSTNAVKFMLSYKVGKVSSSTSENGSMPADAKRLADVLTVPIKSGEYKYGQATKLVTFKGVTYSLLVHKPKK